MYLLRLLVNIYPYEQAESAAGQHENSDETPVSTESFRVKPSPVFSQTMYTKPVKKKIKGWILFDIFRYHVILCIDIKIYELRYKKKFSPTITVLFLPLVASKLAYVTEMMHLKNFLFLLSIALDEMNLISELSVLRWKKSYNWRLFNFNFYPCLDLFAAIPWWLLVTG